MAGYFQLKDAAGGQFMFNLKAVNHEVILTSTLYATKAVAENGITSVRTNSAIDAHFDRKTSKENWQYFVLVAGDRETIGKSAMYSSSSTMETGINSVKTNALAAATEDRTRYDKTYLGQLVARRTGLSQADADQRVTQVSAAVKKAADDAAAKAKEAADIARKISAASSLWIFVSLLLGAFCASFAATFGGRQRDMPMHLQRTI